MHADEKYGGFLTHGLTLSIKRKEESPYKPDPVHRFREWITIHLVTQLLT